MWTLVKTDSNMFTPVQRKLESHGYCVSTRQSEGTSPASGHWHYGYEVLLVHSGQIELFGRDSYATAGKGFAVVLQGEAVHAIRPMGQRYVRSAIHFDPGLLRHSELKSVNALLEERTARVVTLSGDSFRRTLWATHELKARLPAQTTRSLLQLVLSEVCAAAEENPADAYPEMLNAILQYMASNLDTRESVRELACKFFISERQLHRLFKQHLGCSPQHYWRRLRLSRALEILPSSPAPVKQIANRLGYASQRGFEQAFKEHTGLSPGEYRRFARTQ